MRVNGRYKSAVELRIQGTFTIQGPAEKFRPNFQHGFHKLAAQADKTQVKNYPSPAGGNLTREDYRQPTDVIWKGKLLVYMLQL